MKKIVLALALAVVTPAVLVAQENGNAYNQNGNEVIAQSTQSEPASITSYGPEGKMLSLSDRALARIRQNRIKKEQEEQQKTQAPQEPEKQANTEPAKSNIDESAFFVGREGHMMALGNLGQKGNHNQQNTVRPAKKAPAATTNTQRPASNFNPYVGPEGHRMATGNYVREAKKEAPVATYVREADNVAHNHQVVLSQKASQKSTKKRNSSFLRTVRSAGSAIGHALAANAQYEK